MKQQQPDKLFHDKLNSFSKPAPPMAWDEIESRLHNRRKTFVWVSVAASVSILLISGYLYRLSSSDTQNLARAIESETTVQSPKQKHAPVAKPLSDSSVQDKKIRRAGVKENRVPNAKSNAKPIIDTQDTFTTTEEPANEDGSKHFAQVVIVDSAMARYQEPQQLAFNAPKNNDNVTIVMSAAESSEYLVKNKLNTEATSEEKKSSTLKKLLKKASDLKVNQDPFGDLRQKKNEILALNFRSEKQRGQKK